MKFLWDLIKAGANKLVNVFSRLVVFSLYEPEAKVTSTASYPL